MSEHKEIEKCISLISLAELFKLLKHNDNYKKYKLKDDRIRTVLDNLKDYINLKIILNNKIGEIELKGILISHDIIQFVKIHEEIRDCIHVDFAKSHNLWVLTNDKKIGKLKRIYRNILTEKKFMKQFHR